MQRALNGFLSDGIIINNAANFYRLTKPITRVDGSALVIGDVWFNRTNNKQYAWNGTYFERPFPISIEPSAGLTVTGSSQGVPLPANSALLIKRVDYQVSSGGVHSSSNFWDVGLRLIGAVGVASVSSQLTTNTQSLTNVTTYDTLSATGGYVTTSATERLILIWAIKNASAPSIGISAAIEAWEIL